MLVKSLGLQDFKAVSIFMSRDSRFFKALGESSKIGEAIYPQLLWKQVFFDVPFFFSAMMSVARLFMSKRALEKISLCPGDAKSDIRRCPFVRAQGIPVEDIPSFLGGGCKCPHPLPAAAAAGAAAPGPGYCVAGFSNEISKIVGDKA